MGAHEAQRFTPRSGKLLSLHNEPPTNVDSGNWFLCEPSAGVGYNSPSIIQQFNHDEFGYFKIRSHVPFRVAMIMRFHSPPICTHTRDNTSRRRVKSPPTPASTRRRYPLYAPLPTRPCHQAPRQWRRAVTKIDWAAYERLVRRYFPGGEVPWQQIVQKYNYPISLYCATDWPPGGHFSRAPPHRYLKRHAGSTPPPPPPV